LVSHVVSHSKVSFHSIFSNSTPYNNTHIKSIQNVLFQRSLQLLLIAFCFENSFHKLQYLEESCKNFLSKFYEIWPIDIPLIDVFTKSPMCFNQRFILAFCLLHLGKPLLVWTLPLKAILCTYASKFSQTQ